MLNRRFLLAAVAAALSMVPVLAARHVHADAGAADPGATARATPIRGDVVRSRALENYEALAERPSVHPEVLPAGAPRAIQCDPAAFPEGEANCGLDQNGNAFDTTNGGCSSTFQFFSPTFCGDIICGTSAWNGVFRDTDWYEITIFSEQSLTWEVTPDFDADIGLAGGTNGVPDCSLVTGISPFRRVPRGQTDSVTVCLPPGTWWFVVLPATDQVPFPCGREYEARLTCATPCITGACCFGAQCDNGYTLDDCLNAGGVYLGDGTDCTSSDCNPPANDDCANAETIVPGQMALADLRTATLEMDEDLPPCALPGGVASVWFKFAGNGEQIRLTTCSSETFDTNATDSVIAVYTGADCGSLTFQLCNDDAGCGGNGRLSDLCTFATQIGTTYWVQVLAWSEDTRARYTLETSFPCTQPDPTGACCVPLEGDSFCFEIEQSDCESTFDGLFLGPGSICDTADCTGVEIPPNNNCEGAITLAPGESDLNDTTYATDEGTIDDCGLPITSPGVWYRVVGTGNTMTAHLCSGNTLFDAKLHVYCDDCGGFSWECAAANDDGLQGGCGSRPSVSWCSAPGAVYYVLVSGVDDQEGLFEIAIEDDATPCATPVSCTGSCFVSCPPGATPEGEPGCTANYVDTTNGGCGFDPVVYGSIQPGETVCGSSGTYDAGAGRGRDVDWFAFSLEQECDVTWTVRADFLVETFILTQECGLGLFSYAEAEGNACQDVVVQVTLEPGDYALLVQPQFFFGVDCGFDTWYGTLDCVPTANNGACCLDLETCVETTEEYCAQLGGGFGEPGQSCASVTCEIVSDCPTDLDGSGTVDVFDFAIFGPNFGTMSGATEAEGDFDGDGDVDVFDFGIFAPTFGDACP